MIADRAQPDFGSSDVEARAKLRELILHIADKSANDVKFGATKLNKILYFADFLSYLRRGKSITGAQYFKLERGPAPRSMLPVKEQLEQSGDAVAISVMYHGLPQKRIFAQRKARLDEYFSAEDIAFVDDIIEMLKDEDGSSVSSMSHGLAWKVYGDRESIPYQSAFLTDGPPSESDIEWAKREIQADKERCAEK